MKTFIYIFFLLFSIYSNNLFSSAEAQNPVLDTTGKNLRTGDEYYVLPVFRGRGGGLTLNNITNELCPLGIVQDNLEVNSGLPLIFTPVTNESVIRLSTDLNVKFSAMSICVQSTLWKLEAFDEVKNQSFIGTGGTEGNPGSQTLSNWFKIEKSGRDYNFRFCPTVCDICRVICRDVGIYIEDGVRRLALSDVPFKVMFKKVV